VLLVYNIFSTVNIRMVQYPSQYCLLRRRA